MRWPERESARLTREPLEEATEHARMLAATRSSPQAVWIFALALSLNLVHVNPKQFIHFFLHSVCKIPHVMSAFAQQVIALYIKIYILIIILRLSCENSSFDSIRGSFEFSPLGCSHFRRRRRPLAHPLLAKMTMAAASLLLSSPTGPGKPGFGFGFPFRSCCRVHCHSGYINNAALSVFEVSEKRSLVRRSPVWHEKVWLHSKKKKVIMGLSAASARHFKGVGRTSALRSSSGERETVSVDLSPWENHVVLSRDPSVILIKNMVPQDVCASLIEEAAEAGFDASPVAYAGWSSEFETNTRTIARGPAVWAALVAVLLENNGIITGPLGNSRPALAATAIITYAIAAATGAALAYAAVEQKRNALKDSRTSQSVALDPKHNRAAETYVVAAERLFATNRRLFERPTAIRYKPGDRLAPHYDANVAASTEDRERGGQTLATLLLYCNDPETGETGGQTRFGKLDISVAPKCGDALLFFPASADGAFDDRVEHEGVAPTISTKVIARIWRHAYDVAPPMGMAPESSGT